MRRVLLILLLVALVPLRAWAADAMAIQMTAQAHPASAVAAVGASAVVHTNCHEMQAQAITVPQNGNTQDPCTTCAACQACFTVALLVSSPQSATQVLPHGLPQTASPQFTSAILALGHKPPIS